MNTTLTPLQQDELESCYQAYTLVDKPTAYLRLYAASKVLNSCEAPRVVYRCVDDMLSDPDIPAEDVWTVAAKRLGISEDALHLAIGLVYYGLPS